MGVFHCAGHGEKWELLAKKPAGMPVGSLYAAAIPNEFSMAYASAVLHGRAEVVTDEAEQVKAMLLLPPRPQGAWAGSASIWKKYMSATRVVRIVPETVTGKSYAAGEGAPRLRRSLKEGGWKADDRGTAVGERNDGKSQTAEKGQLPPFPVALSEEKNRRRIVWKKKMQFSDQDK